jgi:hypothetical protein
VHSVSGDLGAFCVSWNFSELFGWFSGWLVSSATRHGLFGLFDLCPLFTQIAKVQRLLKA